jgi:RNA polymerase sigma-70 factor (ECF subfamily)
VTATDAEIIGRVRRGETEAYGLLVERYERAVLGAIVSVVNDRHAAEDIAQEVFTRGYLKLPTLRDGLRFVSWLMKIARRQARRSLHHRQRPRELPLLQAAEPADTRTDGRCLHEEQQGLLRHVQRLPAQERLVISLRYFDGLSVQGIADMTGRPVGTITKRLSRAVERLRRSVGKEKPW